MTEQEEQEQGLQAAQSEQPQPLPPPPQQTAAIKVLCRADTIQDTANMLNWALGHRVEIAEEATDEKIGCLFVFTDIEYYENDTTLLERLGFDMIGKIKGVVSWEILLGNQQGEQTGDTATGLTVQETELMHMLCTLPITISIMPRQGEKYAWKCLQATGKAETFSEALEEALTHLTRTFQLIRSELMA
ncbi:MAG TPA: hypothetical protein VFV38_39450 [Ktedonobacteraceae bacterium]|nr:hypothetical protein [Ktedonobacteraceae bacterium]